MNIQRASRAEQQPSQGEPGPKGNRGLSSASLLIEAPLVPFVIWYLLRPQLYSAQAEALVPPSLTHPIWFETQALWVGMAFTLGLWQGLKRNSKHVESLFWAYIYVALAFAVSSLVASIFLSLGSSTIAKAFRIASVALGLATASPLVFLPALLGAATSRYLALFLVMDVMAIALSWLGHWLGSRQASSTSYFPTSPYIPEAASSSSPSRQAQI